MVYTFFLILLWPLVIFLCYKFIFLNINELKSNTQECDANNQNEG